MATMGIPANLQGPNKFAGIKMENTIDQQVKKLGDNRKISRDMLDKINGSNKNANLYRKKKNEFGKDDFFKLLAQQVKHQDPTKPMDQNKFLSDLTQFSQLEQLNNMNQAMAEKEQRKILEDKFHAASFLGKIVSTSGNTLFFDGKNETRIHYYLPRPAKQVRIRIFDNKNNLIGQIDKENVGPGAQFLDWGGQTLDNNISDKGKFRFAVKAWDEQLSAIEGQTKISGKVSGVHFDKGQLVLTVNGQNVGLQDVDSFEIENKLNNDTSAGSI